MENHGNLGGHFVYFIVEMCFFLSFWGLLKINNQTLALNL